MGDRDRQKIIRAKTPDVHHCDLLRMSPNACDGCTKNPYGGQREIDQEFVQEHSEIIGWAIKLGDYAAASLLRETEITTSEAIAIRIALNEKKLSEMKTLAKLTGYKIAEILAKMF